MIFNDMNIATTHLFAMSDSILNATNIKSEQIEINKCDICGPITIDAKRKLITGNISTNNVGMLFDFNNNTTNYSISLICEKSKINTPIIINMGNIDESYDLETFEISLDKKIMVDRSCTLPIHKLNNLNY